MKTSIVVLATFVWPDEIVSMLVVVSDYERVQRRLSDL